MKILYITYIDFGNYTSGSNVRPQKMYDAFIGLGHEVFLIETQQNNYIKRNKVVLNAIKWIGKHQFDFCYCELPSGPIFNELDILLIKYVSKKGIPISVFYRDAFWLLGKDVFHNTGIKSFLISLLQKRDLRVFKKHINTFYMPSISSINDFRKYYNLNNMRPLPPGTEYLISDSFELTYTGIYVGGSSYAYGVDNLIEAYKIINATENKYKLIIVTRENELTNEYELASAFDWLTILHLSGKEELEPVYRLADCAFLPLRKSLYMDIAIAIKMYEYISYGLPIIVNDLYEMKSFIETNQIGISYNQTAESLASCILEYYNSGKYEIYRDKILAVCRENLWQKRAETIISDVESIRK